MPPPPLPLLVAPMDPGVVNGTDGDDDIYDLFVDAQGDRLNDAGSSVLGGNGHDYIAATPGDDALWGEAGNDDLAWDSRNYFNTSDDTLVGGLGNDMLTGSGGADLLVGDGPDVPPGQGGDDAFWIFDGDHTAFGGSGDDSFRIEAPHPWAGEIRGEETTPTGNQVIVGGEAEAFESDSDTLYAQTNIFGATRIDTHLTVSGHEQGTLQYGDRTVDFFEIERINLADGNDRVEVMAGPNMFINAQDGYDILVLPEPAVGEAEPVFRNFHQTPYGKSGTVTFDDGTELKFSGFEEIICFAAGTLIDTDQGPKPVETLRIGDRVLTRGAGFQPLVWTGARALTQADLSQCPQAAPIRIDAGALAPGVPAQALTVSPRHRVLIQGTDVDLMFGVRDVLVAAADLLALPGVNRVTGRAVTYVHVMCGAHQILKAHGAWSESFHPSASVINALDSQTKAELLALFPALANCRQSAAEPVLSPAEAGVLLAQRAP